MSYLWGGGGRRVQWQVRAERTSDPTVAPLSRTWGRGGSSGCRTPDSWVAEEGVGLWGTHSLWPSVERFVTLLIYVASLISIIYRERCCELESHPNEKERHLQLRGVSVSSGERPAPAPEVIRGRRNGSRQSQSQNRHW